MFSDMSLTAVAATQWFLRLEMSTSSERVYCKPLVHSFCQQSVQDIGRSAGKHNHMYAIDTFIYMTW